MPWMETEPMFQRMEFVMRVESGLYTMAEACRRSGVSRKTGYKIWKRWLAENIAADSPTLPLGQQCVWRKVFLFPSSNSQHQQKVPTTNRYRY